MILMGYNILEGGTGRIDPLAEGIRQCAADVVVLPEASDEESFGRLADRLKMDGFRATNPRDPAQAVGLLTRFPLVDAMSVAPLDRRLTRALVTATVRTPHGPFTVVGAHLHARPTPADEAVRLAELPAVLEIAARLEAAGAWYALVGDFNAHHPAQQIDPANARPSTPERGAGHGAEIPRALVRQILDAGLLDAHQVLHSPADFGTSFTTSHPAWRVDYIFLPARLQGALRRCVYPHLPIARYASDHYPVVAELDLAALNRAGPAPSIQRRV
jgi:endonuclease/exonuclease/phosphatase family metal-dependent hydrolase